MSTRRTSASDVRSRRGPMIKSHVFATARRRPAPARRRRGAAAGFESADVAGRIPSRAVRRVAATRDPRPVPMLTGVLKKVFGSRNERLLKQYRRSVVAINALEPSIAALSDDALRGKTAEFKARHRGRRSRSTTCCPRRSRSSARRRSASLGMRHFDVQLLGGIALHEGKIAEMRTGEGKTLTATLPVYLNALTGNGRPSRHRQRLPRAARRRVDGTALRIPRADRRREPVADAARPTSSRRTRPTSRTARTTSSASTTCATTWCTTPATACSAGWRTRSSTRSTRS